MTGPAAALPPITYSEVIDLAHEHLGDQPVFTPASGEAMRAFLDLIEGRVIDTPDHEHEHRIHSVEVKVTDIDFQINLIVTPCPVIDLTIVQVGTPKCPECGDGKHGNCDGWAWDFDRDDVAPCPCAKGEHQ